MLRSGTYKRQWYVEKMTIRNPLYAIHKNFGYVYNTVKECEDAINAKIKIEGGELLTQMPCTGRKKRYT